MSDTDALVAEVVFRLANRNDSRDRSRGLAVERLRVQVAGHAQALAAARREGAEAMRARCVEVAEEEGRAAAARRQKTRLLERVRRYQGEGSAARWIKKLISALPLEREDEETP